jgi:ABC-type Zn uptake system ZnuABC Zn-binding protein ZnuA
MVRQWVAALLFAAMAVTAQAQLRVVATTTDLRSLAEIVGGDRVAVTHILPPTVNAEDYQAKPQDLGRTKSADLIVRVGADYDLWLDRLLAQAPPALRRGGARHVDASTAIALLDVRSTSLGAGDGHAHGSGNPHYWLDPNNAAIITGTLLEALARIDPNNAKHYEARRIAFLDRLETKRVQWERLVAPIQGKSLVAYHNTWAYFARRFRLKVVDYIEIKEGVPPTAAHLARLVRTMRDQQVIGVIRQPHEAARDAEYLAGRGNAKVIVLAASVGATPAGTDYLAMIEANLIALASLMGPKP